MANEVQDQPAEAFDEVEIIDEKGQAIITQAAQRQDAEQEVQSRDQRAAQRQDAEKYKIERSGSKFNLLEEKTSGIFKKETKFVPTGRSVNLVNNKVNPDNADFKNVRDVEIKLSEKGILGGKNAGPVTVKLALSTADGKVDPNQKLCIKFNKENKPESMMMGDKDLDLAKVRFNGKLAYLVDDQGNPSHSIPLNSDKFLDYYLQANEIDLGKDKKKFLNEFKKEFKDEFSLEEIKVAAAAVSSGETLSEMVNSIKEKRVRVAGGQGAEAVADAQMDTAAPEKPTIAVGAERSALEHEVQSAEADVVGGGVGQSPSSAVEYQKAKKTVKFSDNNVEERFFTAGSRSDEMFTAESRRTQERMAGVLSAGPRNDPPSEADDLFARPVDRDAEQAALAAARKKARELRGDGKTIPSPPAPAEVSRGEGEAHEQGERQAVPTQAPAASPAPEQASGRPVSPDHTPPRSESPSRVATGRGGRGCG